MDQLDKIERILSDHVKNSNEDRLEIAKQLVVIETKMETNYKKIAENSVHIENLNSLKNQGKGAFWIFGLFWLAFTIGVPLIISWFNNHK